MFYREERVGLPWPHDGYDPALISFLPQLSEIRLAVLSKAS